MSKKSIFRGCFDKQHDKRAQALLKCVSQHVDQIHRSLPRKVCSKKPLLLTCQILGLVVNTYAAAEKHIFLHRDNLTIPIQMHLSEKQKFFYNFSATFLKFRLNLEHFKKER